VREPAGRHDDERRLVHAVERPSEDAADTVIDRDVRSGR